MTDHAKEIQEIAWKYHTHKQWKDSIDVDVLNHVGYQLSDAAAEIRRLQSENARLQTAVDLLWPKTAAIPGCGGGGFMVRLEETGK